MNDLTPFEKQLQHELQVRVTEMQHAQIPDAMWKNRSRPHHFRWLWKASAAGLMLNKLAVGGLTALLLAGASVGVKAVVTGSPDPLVWGHSISQQTIVCRSQSNNHGVGSCVSSHASMHGVQVRTQAKASSHGNSQHEAQSQKGSHHGNAPHSARPTPSPPSVQPTPPVVANQSLPVQPPAPTGIPSPRFG
ncbi:MAG: hypothetical protein ACP5OR_01110 [Candidatus Dormibacteria bacterium]